MTTNKYEIVSISAGALSPSDLIAQRQLLAAHMKESMKPGVHYGEIPGCGDKPALFKAGAEYLLFIFNLACGFKHELNYDFGGKPGHLQVTSTCTLTHRPSGTVVSEGTGICSTLESKYRYRNSFTGRPVPADYWTTKDKSILGGPQFDTRKVNGEWQIVEQVEYDNPADYYNTVIKMADKRAIVAAVLYSTAASDTFTQDIEDAPELYARGETPKQKNTVTKPSGYSDVRLATPAQLKLLNYELNRNKISVTWAEDCLDAVTGKRVMSTKDVSILIDMLKSAELDKRLHQFVGAPAKQDEESAHI